MHSSSMLCSGGMPIQALSIFSIAQRCLKSALTTGVPRGTRGAFNRYERIERTLRNPINSSSGRSARLKLMREQSSDSSTRSRIMGLARSESSQVLCTTMVFWPPIRISDVYSSIARLLSPVTTEASMEFTSQIFSYGKNIGKNV